MSRGKKPNPGWFRKGYDPRRHVFTAEERQRGGQTAYAGLLSDRPWTARWVRDSKILPQARATRNAALLAYIRERNEEFDDIPY